MDALSERRSSSKLMSLMRPRWPRTTFSRTIAAALQAEDRPDGEVTLLVTDNKTVAAYNQQSRGVEGQHRRALVRRPGTDARFRHHAGDGGLPGRYRHRTALHPLPGRGAQPPLHNKLRLLAVHGTLHLLGYDHADPEKEAIMWAKQDSDPGGVDRGPRPVDH